MGAVETLILNMLIHSNCRTKKTKTCCTELVQPKLLVKFRRGESI